MILMQCSTFEEEKKWAWRVDMKGGLSTKIVGQLFMQSMKKRVSQIWYYLATGSKSRAK